MINIIKIINNKIKIDSHESRFKKISWLKTKIIKHENDFKIKRFKTPTFEIYYQKPYELLHTYNDIFVDEIYKFDSTNDAPTIIDCGSNIGLSILYFKTLFKNANIVAFEPDENNYLLLEKNIKENQLKEVNLQKKAVWINNDEIQFEAKGTEASKIDFSNNLTGITVQCARLKDVIEKYDEIDFLKIDIEGAEYEVLLDIQHSLKKINNIFLEYHGKINEIKKLRDIIKIMAENSFKIYIKNAADLLSQPFFNKKTELPYDVQLNIFCFK